VLGDDGHSHCHKGEAMNWTAFIIGGLAYCFIRLISFGLRVRRRRRAEQEAKP
jgi:hypothetical protein